MSRMGEPSTMSAPPTTRVLPLTITIAAVLKPIGTGLHQLITLAQADFSCFSNFVALFCEFQFICYNVCGGFQKQVAILSADVMFDSIILECTLYKVLDGIEAALLMKMIFACDATDKGCTGWTDTSPVGGTCGKDAHTLAVQAWNPNLALDRPRPVAAPLVRIGVGVEDVEQPAVSVPFQTLQA